MKIEDMIRGESKNTEFKEILPSNSEKYAKTIVAFANTQGGKLIIGVADQTRKIVGVDEANLFQTMDSISNAISDSCEPQLVPDIEPYTIDKKTIIIVSVAPGPHRPYYLKSKGRDRGTYIRVGATTRLALPEKIKELELEGAKISWDELTCIGYSVTEKAIKKLCSDMNRYRKEMVEHGGRAEKLPTVTRTNLENWNVLKKTDEGYLASNAFALLTGTHFPYSKTQCAVFAGTERGEFIDKQDYTGPLYEQIEGAYAFVLRNIRRSAKVEGLIRREGHELPPDAIREMIINAHCHRNFLDEACIQVALYDDRLEVTSPGGLCYGLTLEEALSGRSRQRNRAIAEVFSQMGLIEAWGNGLKSIAKSAKEYHLPSPEFIEMPETFRVNLYRNATSVMTSNVGNTASAMTSNVGNTASAMTSNVSEKELNETQKKILSLLSLNPSSSSADIAKQIGVSKRSIERNINSLKAIGVLLRHGNTKNSTWEVVKSKVLPPV
ncbi:putative DNA binding domain-containing protein [bacterium]|nr:putative DNA binding domain-containing protein [bacterium]